MTLEGHIPSSPGGQTCYECTDIGPLLDECYMPLQLGGGGTQVQILVLAQMTSTVSFRSGSGGWHRGRIRYDDRYRTSGVK